MSDEDFIRTIFKAPYQIGDILYIRETWQDDRIYTHDDTPGRYLYRADDGIEAHVKGIWKPSIHMPKEAARIFLRITSVRAERLQEIDGQGVLKEGVNTHVHPNASYFDVNQREAFARLWDSTIKKEELAKYGWEADPWVWVYEFERVEVEP